MRFAVVVLLLGGCATGTDEPGGGASNLPHTPVLPITVPEQAIVMAQADTDLSGPWGSIANDGTMVIWAAADDAIVRSDDPSFALKAELAWQNGKLADPSVVRIGNGWLMAFTAGNQEAIGLAASKDTTQWDTQPDAILTPEPAWEDGTLHDPSLVVETAPSRLLLFYIGGNGSGIGLAQSMDEGATFSRLISAPLIPRLDGEEASEFDAAPLTGAACKRGETALGRPLYECYLSARGKAGYAAGFEPASLQRFSINPILAPKGLDLADPMRVQNKLLYSRNRKPLSPLSGRVIGTATFSE